MDKSLNEVQVWVPAEHLAKGVTPEMMETYREVEDCWKWKAIDEGTDKL